MTYDFKRLSGSDFEEVVHDLLQVAWTAELEIFAGGRDSGIDLRRRDSSGLTIVQCKNYEGSGFSKLKTKMRDDELPKVQRNTPDRYVLVTSVDLSVGQKDELFELLTPWVKTPSDIVGKKELTALLDQNDEVVRRHHKLWLTSVAVMQQILLGAEQVQTSAEIARMQRMLDVYVETDALPRAVRILEEQHVLIVSGEPGIGKSTLADMIILDHLANGFQPAVIRSSLSEGRRMAANGKPTIFYFDDFLGQTYLGDRPDFLGKREDADLVDFIEWVRNSKVHRFVLTTREHVLSEAVSRSERFRHARLADDRCLVTIKDLNRSQRARILYNHLEFSDLSATYKREMLRDDFFMEVIDFDRFNPRVISWLSSFNQIKAVPVEGYQQYVRELMKNPLEIWRHAFEQELSQAARDILVALYSFTYRAYVDDLQRCFDTLHASSIRRLNGRTTGGAFRLGMKELDGSFITINNEGEVRFINPSIADFVATVLRDDPNAILNLIGAAVLFNQVSMLIEGAEGNGPLASVMDLLKDNGAAIVGAFERLLNSPQLRWFDRKEGRVGIHVDMAPSGRAARLLNLRDVFPGLAPVAAKSVARVAEAVGSRQLQLNETQGLLKFALTSRRARADVSEVVTAVRKGLRHAYAEDWLAILDLREAIGDDYEEHFPDMEQQLTDFVARDLSDEINECDTAESASDLHYVLERLQERHNVNLRDELEQVEERQADLEEQNSSRRREDTSEDFFGSRKDREPVVATRRSDRCSGAF
jgi:anion-transporting  ArsA/GET3 family ATPase